MSLSQQGGGDRLGRLLRPGGHLAPPLPQCLLRLGERGGVTVTGVRYGWPREQHPHGGRFGRLRSALVRRTWGALVRGRRGDPAHVDADTVDGVCGSSGSEHADRGRNTERPGAWAPTVAAAEGGHGTVERLDLLLGGSGLVRAVSVCSPCSSAVRAAAPTSGARRSVGPMWVGTTGR